MITDIFNLAYDTALFEQAFERIQEQNHDIALKHGWWDSNRGDLECIALIMSELGEAVEAIRGDAPQSDHIPAYRLIEEEFADVIIRIMDLSERRGYNVAGALIAKMSFNEQREYKHGKAL